LLFLVAWGIVKGRINLSNLFYDIFALLDMIVIFLLIPILPLKTFGAGTAKA